jgi:integrase
MTRKAEELSALVVGRMKTPGLWAVGGVAGLYLCINSGTARSWILRMVVGTKRRDMGLGGFPDVTLAQAREKARQARAEVDQGVDPILQRKTLKSALAAQQATDKTFAQAATAYIDAHSDSWRNPKHRGQWASTLDTYVFPTMGHLLVRDVSQEHVLAALEPIWKTKTETATRVRGRIESVLSWATVRKYRTGENPARWKGHLDQLLPKPSSVSKVAHHPALKIDAIAGFMSDLRKREGTAARALEFAILTAARSGEVRGATWGEIDLKAAVWAIPAARMKAGREHRVPLSAPLVVMLNKDSNLQSVAPGDLLFPAPRGGVLSDMTLTAVMRRMAVAAVPHGFRSTFRDWCSERTNYPRDLAEQALAHAVESKVEAAYRRGDALEKRRAMMTEWAKHCDRVAALDGQDIAFRVKV